jgi:competence protein ComEC
MKPKNEITILTRTIDFLFRRHLVIIAIAYIAGITASYLRAGSTGFLFYFSCLPVVVILALAAIKALDLFRAVLFLFVFAAGWAAFYFSFQTPAGSIVNYAGEPVYVEGTVSEEPLVFADYSEYQLSVALVETKIDRFPATGVLLVRVYGQAEEHFKYGEKLRVRGTVVEARGMRNPGGFDYNYYLKSRGIDALIYPSGAMVESLGSEDLNELAGLAVNLRMELVNNIEKALPEPAGNLLSAILFGQKHRLPTRVEENFRKAGAGHLMAVSGLHVGLVAALVAGLFRLFGLKGRFPLVVAILLVIAYACLTGLRPSAVRAALMVSAALGALILDREQDLPSAIAFAALVTLVYNPLLLFTVGFQLSYAATLAIIYAGKPLSGLLSALHCPRFLNAPLTVTLAAQLGVIPLTVYHFYTLSTGALLFNLVLMPLMGLIVGFGMSGAVISLFLPRIGALLINASYPLLEMMIKITSLGDHPLLYMPVRPPGLAMIIGYYIVCLIIIFFYYKRQDGLLTGGNDSSPERIIAARIIAFLKLEKVGTGRVIIFILAVVVIIAWGGIYYGDVHALRVTFIDVGQGASAFIESPCGATILIDAGGKPAYYGDPGEVGEMIVMPFLLYKGVKKIDLAVITHPHEDHYGGFIPLVDHFSIGKMLISPVQGEADYYISLLENTRLKNITVEEVIEGQVWAFPCGLLLEVKGPPTTLYQSTSSDLNNNSVVIMLHYGEYKILFTGDIEDTAVGDLLARDAGLGADLLQIPHHGGYLALMPQLLEAVDPYAAVIQVGTNSFGHPHSEIIQALQIAGVQIFRNDHHGAVTVTINSRGMEIQTTEENRAVMLQ